FIVLGRGRGSRTVSPHAVSDLGTDAVPEAPELLGVSDKSVYRQIERGLLRSAGGMRHKQITPAEIERFLKATTGLHQ
ncbi:MAG: helix-turn-helix domain-containing protein, partial [Verrucomicrobiota bacterium]